jgi:hypothetical protein
VGGIAVGVGAGRIWQAVTAGTSRSSPSRMVNFDLITKSCSFLPIVFAPLYAAEAVSYQSSVIS